MKVNSGSLSFFSAIVGARTLGWAVLTPSLKNVAVSVACVTYFSNNCSCLCIPVAEDVVWLTSVQPEVTELESGIRPSGSWAAGPGSCFRPPVFMGVSGCSGYRGGYFLLRAVRAFWRGCVWRFFDIRRSGSLFFGPLSEQSGVSPTLT